MNVLKLDKESSPQVNNAHIDNVIYSGEVNQPCPTCQLIDSAEIRDNCSFMKQNNI